MSLRHIGIAVVAGMFLVTVPIVIAAEHGGKEHGGKEHGGAQVEEPSKADIQQAMKKYVEEKSAKTGAFEIRDPETDKTRRLEFIRVHDRVGKTGGMYYSCADFKDLESNETLDLDLDVRSKDGKLNVSDVRIHKVNGKERYTYDGQDNRMPVR